MATEDSVSHDVAPGTKFPSRSDPEPARWEVESPAICVICLERLVDLATALPCHHKDFHFSCLCTWLNQSRCCPLCKSSVTAVRYHDRSEVEVFHLPPRTNVPTCNLQHRRQSRQCRRTEPVDEAVAFRKRVYQHGTFSYYVASNSFTCYRNIDHVTIANNPELATKAKRWIRRELKVFDFLQPDSASFGRVDRRATNAEYLLEYILAIIKAIDIKGSAGQAEALLSEFLGSSNAQLFLHELENWLRSPFSRLDDWDEAVQYLMPE